MYKMYLGKAISELRENKRMSQTDLSEACGIRQSSISLYESGKSMPGEKNIGRIASALGCTPDDIRSLSIKLRNDWAHGVGNRGPSRDAARRMHYPESIVTYITEDVSVVFRPIVRDNKDMRSFRFNPITDIVEQVLHDYIEASRDEIEELIAERIETGIGDVTQFLDDLKRKR